MHDDRGIDQLEPDLCVSSIALHQLESLQVDGFVLSELRLLGSILDQFNQNCNLCAELEPGEYRLRIDQQLQDLSQRLEIIHSALQTEFGDNHRYNSVYDLISAVRTWCDNFWGWREDVYENTEGMLGLINREYQYTLTQAKRSAGSQTIPLAVDCLEFDVAYSRPSSSLWDAVEEICSDLVIDLDSICPQEGFGREVSAHELADGLANPGDRLFVPRLNSKPIGIYQMNVGPDAIPTRVKEALRLAKADPSILAESSGWGAIVGLSKSGREELRRHGVSGYSLLTATVLESARGQGLYRLLGEVRVGAQANTAREKHLAAGWETTGVIYEHSGHPYEILILSAYHNVRERVAEIELAEGALPALTPYWPGRVQRVAGMTSEHLAANARDVNELQISLESYAEEIALIRAKFEKHGPIEIYVTNGRISILVKDNDRAVSFKQKIPGHDLWKIEAPDHDDRGLSNRMRALRELVTNYDTLKRVYW
ncbi:MAG: hypothetical protein H6619_03100 [Deltaproteobacteria bacterium]|nr:hypothetical protein [Deltaproteobacteria bacterium]